MERIKVVDGVLYQWDSGRKVRITPGQGESVDFVHYSNGNAVEVVKDGDSVTALIPNILLQTAQNFTVYAVIVSADGTRTVCDCTFPVRAKPKPDDYVYTPTDTMTWQDLNSRLKKLEEGGGSGGGGSVELDTTLTKKGKAADAKAVGDRIGDIETALDGIIAIQNELIGGGGV